MSHETLLRAEQGVLAALLAGIERDLILDTLVSDDFAHPLHRAVFRAVLDMELTGADTAKQLAALAVILADDADVRGGWLAALAAGAPDAEHTLAYLRIVVEASFDRDTADFAQPYLAAAQAAADTAQREALLRTARALDRQAEIFTPASSIAPGMPTAILAGAVTAVVGELHREEKVIADLLQHPEQARRVVSWLTSDVFTTHQRRLAFEIAISAAYHDDPIDAVIIAWQMQRARDIDRLYQKDAEPPAHESETDYQWLKRLERTAIAVGTAVVVGHELVHEHTAAALALSAAAAAERVLTRAARTGDQHQDPLPQTITPMVDGPRIQM
jgi:replicative DNA helicase